MIVVWAREIPRSAIISTRSRKLSLNRRYQRTQRMMISRSKWRPLKRSSMLNMLGQLHRRANLPRVCPASAICTRAIHHSDRGSQYAATDYRKVLDGAAMIQSMSRKGNCWDNAPMESCFGTIKTELVHHACYPTREAARHDLFAYIEGYYNRQRLHSALGYITPEQAERQAA